MMSAILFVTKKDPFRKVSKNLPFPICQYDPKYKQIFTYLFDIQ